MKKEELYRQDAKDAKIFSGRFPPSRFWRLGGSLFSPYTMIEIHPLLALDAAAVNRIITGYTSHETFTVTYSDTPDHTAFVLQKTPLPLPYVKQFEPTDETTVQRYNQILTEGYKKYKKV